MAKIFSSVFLLVGMIGSAAAQDCGVRCDGLPPTPGQLLGVPAPDMGEGVVGMLLAAGAVYLITQRAR